MAISYPAPLQPGDRIGVTSPSSGVPANLVARLEFCLDFLRGHGFEVVVGDCMDGARYVSAPAKTRAAELSAMLTDPGIRAVVPPWGGELAIDLLRHLDWAAIERAEPTWFVGYSDISTLLTPLTLRTGMATIHGHNLMDTPYSVPPPLLSWVDVAGRSTGSSFTQGQSRQYRATGFDDWATDPAVTDYTLDAPGGWTRLDGGDDLVVSGRLIGGCIETLSNLSGTPYADLTGFARDHAPEGLLVYLEAAEENAYDIGRRLHGMKLAGWFDAAVAVILGRTAAPSLPDLSQHDAALDALGDLGLPLVADVDCGHLPPHLALVNGAPGTLSWSRTATSLTQALS